MQSSGDIMPLPRLAEGGGGRGGGGKFTPSPFNGMQTSRSHHGELQSSQLFHKIFRIAIINIHHRQGLGKDGVSITKEYIIGRSFQDTSSVSVLTRCTLPVVARYSSPKYYHANVE